MKEDRGVEEAVAVRGGDVAHQSVWKATPGTLAGVGAGATLPGVKARGAAAAATVEDKGGRAWNTRNLGWRVGGDVVAAASAGFLIAPIISIIDR